MSGRPQLCCSSLAFLNLTKGGSRPHLQLDGEADYRHRMKASDWSVTMVHELIDHGTSTSHSDDHLEACSVRASTTACGVRSQYSREFLRPKRS
jgi:hypothetical protein